MSDLTRFLDAQDLHGSYDSARAELERGRKTTHWIWWVFPQIRLGTSENSVKFAIGDRAEVLAWLDHPVLGPRYRECLALVEGHVLSPGHPTDSDEVAARLRRVMGSGIDASKFLSSITLFAEVARITGVHGDVVATADRFFAAGLPACPATLDAIVRGEI